jgi:hypothetical protein
MSTPLRGAVSGAIGSIVALLITFPLATAKVRLQAQNKAQNKAQNRSSYKSATDVINKIINNEGILKLYAGLLPALSKAAGTNFVFFYFFDLLKKFYNRGGKKSSILRSLLHGMSAGACVQLVMLPIDLIVTRLMATGSSVGFFPTFFNIIQETGVLSLWRGLKPGLALTINPGITTLMRNALNDQFLSPSTRLRNFFIGMVSKATASTLTYPYTLIKVQLQVNGMRKKRKKRKKRDKDVEEKDVEEKEMEETATKCTMKTVFNDIVSTSGLSGLWNGLSPQLMNAVLKEALLNMVRLEIANVVNRICDNV